MEPDAQIATEWAEVRESWRNTGKGHLPVPVCEPLASFIRTPTWWCGKQGQPVAPKKWDELLKIRQAHMHEENAQRIGLPPPTPPTDPQKGKGRANTEVPAKRKLDQSSSRGTVAPTQSGQPRAADKATVLAGAAFTETSANPAADRCAADGSGPSGEGPAPQNEGDVPPDVPDDDTRATRTPSPKRRRQTGPEEPAAQSSPPAAVVSPGKQASKERLQHESEQFHIPEPSTPKANTMPSLTPDGVPTALAFVPESSAPIQQGKRAMAQVRSTQSRADRPIEQNPSRSCSQQAKGRSSLSTSGEYPSVSLSYFGVGPYVLIRWDPINQAAPATRRAGRQRPRDPLERLGPAPQGRSVTPRGAPQARRDSNAQTEPTPSRPHRSPVTLRPCSLVPPHLMVRSRHPLRPPASLRPSRSLILP